MSQNLKTSHIDIAISVDENNVPERIDWKAEGEEQGSESKAMMLALWDAKDKTTLRIDLWTKEMTIDEMKQYFHQTLLTMTDTYERATGEKKLVQDMRDFCAYFAEQSGILKQ